MDVLHVDQNGSSLEFSVSWADGGGDGGLEDLALFVDLWVVAQQSDPSAWVELPVAQVKSASLALAEHESCPLFPASSVRSATQP